MSRTILSRASILLRQTTNTLSTRPSALATAIRSLNTLTRPSFQSATPLQARQASHTPSLVRWSSSKAIADAKMEEITELYVTAKDEFEIAAEETENNTVYAEDDRAAAREELTKLQQVYQAVLDGPDKEVAEEIKRRVGGRIRELENAVVAMEEMAMNHD